MSWAPPESTTRAAVSDAAPSEKLVLLVLRREGERTSTQLACETLLPPGTVREALCRLRKRGLITSRRSPDDGRVTVYQSAVDNR